VSLPAVTIANLTNDKSEYGTRMGMKYTVAAIGALIGNPIAAAAREGVNGVILLEGSLDEVMQRWQGAWFIAGGALLFATVLMTWARVLRGGLDLKVKL
jgi:hypothetical protein